MLIEHFRKYISKPDLRRPVWTWNRTIIIKARRFATPLSSKMIILVFSLNYCFSVMTWFHLRVSVSNSVSSSCHIEVIVSYLYICWKMYRKSSTAVTGTRAWVSQFALGLLYHPTVSFLCCRVSTFLSCLLSTWYWSRNEGTEYAMILHWEILLQIQSRKKIYVICFVTKTLWLLKKQLKTWSK